MRDLSRLGRPEARAERPRVVAWQPGPAGDTGVILTALRAAGIEGRIGVRREPAGNFEVSCLAAEAQRVREIIGSVDPEAKPLTVGR